MSNEAPHTEERPATGFSEEIKPLLSIKRMIRLRSRLMIVVALFLGVTLTIAAWLLVPTQYVSSATFQMLATPPRVMDSDVRPEPAPIYDTFVNTQIGLMAGPAILGRIINEPEIQNLPVIAQAADPMTFLSERVSAVQSRRAELVTITCTMPDMDTAKAVLDAVVLEYLAYTREQEADTGGERARILREELVSRQAESDRQAEAIVELQGQTKKYLDAEASEYHKKFIAVDDEVAEKRNNVREISSQISEIETLQDNHKESPGTTIFEYAIEEEVSKDSKITSLISEVIDNEAQLNEFRAILRSESPRLAVEERKLSTLRKSLTALQSSVRGEHLGLTLARFKSDLNDEKRLLKLAEEKTQKYKEILAEYDQRLANEAKLLAGIKAQETKASESRTILEEIRSKISEIELESQAPARISLVAEPTLPEWPDYGRRMNFVALGLLASLCAGVGVGVWKEIADQEVGSVEDVKQISSIPVIAAIPHVSEVKNLISVRLAILSSEYPNSILAEEYRRVSAQVLYPKKGKASSLSTVLVVSPTEGDGKTSLACNLAITLALANRDVLLLDVNSIKPDAGKSFGIDPHKGLTDYLKEGGDFSEYIRPTPTKNLQIMTPGIDSTGLVSMLASKAMTELLRSLEETFDYVIIDTPPALLTSHAELLAPSVDAVIVVVGVGISTLGMVSRCLREIDRANVNLMGIVINGLRAIPGGYLQAHLQLYNDYFGSNGAQSPGSRAAATGPRENTAPTGATRGDRSDDGENE